jgi:hypothetical protein
VVVVVVVVVRMVVAVAVRSASVVTPATPRPGPAATAAEWWAVALAGRPGALAFGTTLQATPALVATHRDERRLDRADRVGRRARACRSGGGVP